MIWTIISWSIMLVVFCFMTIISSSFYQLYFFLLSTLFCVGFLELLVAVAGEATKNTWSLIMRFRVQGNPISPSVLHLGLFTWSQLCECRSEFQGSSLPVRHCVWFQGPLTSMQPVLSLGILIKHELTVLELAESMISPRYYDVFVCPKIVYS